MAGMVHSQWQKGLIKMTARQIAVKVRQHFAGSVRQLDHADPLTSSSVERKTALRKSTCVPGMAQNR